jgi:signal transduction histidine kinase
MRIENALHDGVQQELVGVAANLDRVAEAVEQTP